MLYECNVVESTSLFKCLALPKSEQLKDIQHVCRFLPLLTIFHQLIDYAISDQIMRDVERSGHAALIFYFLYRPKREKLHLAIYGTPQQGTKLDT